MDSSIKVCNYSQGFSFCYYSQNSKQQKQLLNNKKKVYKTNYRTTGILWQHIKSHIFQQKCIEFSVTKALHRQQIKSHIFQQKCIEFSVTKALNRLWKLTACLMTDLKWKHVTKHQPILKFLSQTNMRVLVSVPGTIACNMGCTRKW